MSMVCESVAFIRSSPASTAPCCKRRQNAAKKLLLRTIIDEILYDLRKVNKTPKLVESGRDAIAS